MGNYSLWPLFLAFGINTPPVSVEAYGTTTCNITDQVSSPHRNDVAFPYSSIIHFKFPAQKEWEPFDLFWYDGGMKPARPDELDADKELPREGMMFVGDSGKILGSFHCGQPRIIPEKKMFEFLGTEEIPEDTTERTANIWLDSFLSGEQSPGSFLYAGPVTETILLAAVALQAGRKIEWDAENMKVTNIEDANKFLYREYRPGWEL
ncbi:MAG: hypothetical protein AMS27_03350 [Bacteroides sp. SM23_62_1]|nr:MAG: hypothetical protein AMS27_03350 [Bacteroides sp. SM23_62_1]